jgi:hypothetical protein
MNIKIIALAALLFPCISKAQNFTAHESSESKEDYLHEFFRTSSGTYLAINYASPHSAFSYNRKYNKAHIVGYDAKLNEKYVTFNKDLAGNIFQAAFELNKNLQVFYINGNKLSTVAIDPATGQSIGSETLLLTMKQVPQHSFNGFSPDSNFYFLIFDYATDNGKSNQYEGVVLDKNLKVVRNLSFALEKMQDFLVNTATVLSNDGSFFMIHGLRVKEKNVYRPYIYHITSIDSVGDLYKQMLYQMPEGWLNNIFWRPAEGGLSFTGVLAKKENSGMKYILSGNYYSAEKRLENIREINIVEQPWYNTVADKYTKQTTTVGLYPAARTTKTFINSDGSVVLAMQSVGSSTITSSSFVEVLKVNADGSFGWHHTIPLSQVENLPIYTGIMVTQQDNRDIVVAYLDDPENNTRKPGGDIKRVNVNNGGGQAVAVIIKDNGIISKTLIKTPNDPAFFLAPQQPYKGYENEILYTSYDYKTQGRSRYKLGIIKLR